MKFINSDLEKNAVVQRIELPGLADYKNVFIKREDLIHPEISGNKWRKLKYNLLEAERLQKKTLLTFGGAYSNHIYSVAAAGKEYGFKTIGFIRGEAYNPLNPTLSFAEANGMELRYLNRADYKNINSINFQNDIIKQFNDAYLIPEGGSNSLAVKGCAEIINDIEIEFDYICCACGTGGTLAGITAGLKNTRNSIGFSILKGGGFLKEDVKNLIKNYNGKEFNNWDIILDYHFGGYAKINYELINFIGDFEKTNKIQLDPVYTGKMFFGIRDLIIKGYFKKHDKIIAVHTGGIQGIEGMKNKIKKILASHLSVS
ncbi:MAG: pyridoxal-phosphate dependent enzyme [Bacteroidetes bacterium]|nr:pyridoxal-phosphate dependent enzyme [Bacteroidota bacterium]